MRSVSTISTHACIHLKLQLHPVSLLFKGVEFIHSEWMTNPLSWITRFPTLLRYHPLLPPLLTSAPAVSLSSPSNTQARAHFKVWAGVRLAELSAETPFLQVSTAYSFYTQAPHSKSPLLIPHYWLTTPPASFVLVWIPPVRGKNLWAKYVLKVILGSWSEGVVGENASAGQRWSKWALWVTGGKAVPSRTSKLLSFGESAVGRRELSYAKNLT